MTAALAEVGVTPYAVVNDAWQVYRRSQEIPFPSRGAGDLMAAQSRLFTLTEPSASGRDGAGEADLDAIEDAADQLISAVAWHCGDKAANWVAGDTERRPAA